MSSPTSPEPTPLRDPADTIVVDYDVAAETWSFSGPNDDSLEVQTDGDITIRWSSGERQRRLRFELSAESTDIRLGGLQLDWVTEQKESAPIPSFEVEVPPDHRGRRRSLQLTLSRSLETFDYTLVLLPLVGGERRIVRIDPKIYNQGDGTGGGGG